MDNKKYFATRGNCYANATQAKPNDLHTQMFVSTRRRITNKKDSLLKLFPHGEAATQ